MFDGVPVIKTITVDELDDILLELGEKGATDLALLGPGVYAFYEMGRLRQKQLKKIENIYRIRMIRGVPNQFGILSSLSKLKSVVIWGIPFLERDLKRLTKLKHLTDLKLIGAGIDNVDFNIFVDFPQLTTLDLSGNNVSEKGINVLVGLTQLTSLYLRGARVNDEGVKLLAGATQLTALDLCGNLIGDKGAISLAGLTRLTSFDLSHNKITDEGVKKLIGYADITSLYLNSNQITSKGAEIFAGLTRLTSLDLSYNQIYDEGVNVLAGLTQLTSLGLNNDNITDAGVKALAGLTQLTSLFISGNQIADEGAKTFAGLTRLTALDLSNNQITDAGVKPLAGLTQLISLFLGSNQVTDEGIKIIAGLPELTTLDLCNNQITDKGVKLLALLRNLHVLDLSNNKIVDLSSFRDLKHLKRLNLSNSKVTDLSPVKHILHFDGIITMEKKRQKGWRTIILVENCPLTIPPPEIIKQGHQAVLNYFRALESQGVDKLYEAKMLLVGDGGTGKTSLLRRLYKPDLPLPKEEETTKGIDIIRHSFPLPENRTFHLNVWDFGGQQIYHATHQFFLTRRSLYILLDDTRTDHKSVQDEGFKYWLEAIEALTDASPVLIFQNEKGGRSKQIDMAGIQRRFPNVKNIYRGDLNDKNGAAAIKAAIEFYAANLDHIGDKVPAKWLSVRKDIEAKAREASYVTLHDYFGIYDKHLPHNREQALYLSRYLHDLGVFLHFQDDFCLKNTVILQNHWATEAVFRIIDDETVRRDQKGHFGVADCERLWGDTRYASMHMQLLALMEKFELCYLLADTKPKTWLVPQLLPPSIPDALKDWAKAGDLNLLYRYEFLPKGMINRLMVRMNRFVKQPQLAWSSGVLFEKGATQLLADVSSKGNEIHLCARGPEAKALLSVISSDLDAINQSIQGLPDRLTKLIPCNCPTCQKESSPHLFEEKALLRRKENNRLEVECECSFDKISVLELLEGFKLRDLPYWAEITEQKRDNDDCGGPAVQAPAKSEKTIQIFLASSEELREDRDEFDLYFRQQNDHLRKQGVYLQIIRWENFLDAMSETRLQDEYNKKVRECDIFVSLFKTKTGKFTEEEFDTAHQAFKETGKPKIYTFFKKAEVSTSSNHKTALQSLWAFQEKLKQLGHFYPEYDNISDLKLRFNDQLKMLMNDQKLG